MRRPGYLRGYGDLGTADADILNLIAQVKQLVAQVPASASQAILATKTTTGPTNTVQGVMDWYSQSSVGSGGPYKARDMALLNDALSNLTSVIPAAQPVQVATPAVTQSQLTMSPSTQSMPMTNAVLAPDLSVQTTTSSMSTTTMGALALGVMVLLAVPFLLKKKKSTSIPTKPTTPAPAATHRRKRRRK